MKKIVILALAFMAIIPCTLVCAAAVLTTVSYDGREFLYIGAKKQDEGQNASSAVAVVSSKDFGHELILLPDSISKRDVIGVIPEGQKIFVLTQITSSQDDGPLLSVYNRESKKWKDIQSVDCPIFTKVGFRKKELVFYCERLTKRGKSKVRKKVLSLGSERIHRKGSMRFPEFLIRHRKLDISLEGLALSWDRLHIKKETEDKVLPAAELYAVVATPAVPIAPLIAPTVDAEKAPNAALQAPVAAPPAPEKPISPPAAPAKSP